MDTSQRNRTLRLGTRGSKLARWQAEWVAGELQRLGHAVELVEIATRGDLEQVVAVEEIGTRGVFTKEIQRALLAGDVDIAVHSLKDLPTEPVEGLVLAAVPKRECSADVLVMAAGSGERGTGSEDLLMALHLGARVGTGSLRRQAQLRHVRPDLRLADVRGNVDTRLRKLDEGRFDALVLAEAGLRRLGLADRISQVLPYDVMLPAVGQGALGIECRSEDLATREILSPLNDPATRAAVAAERALLEHLRGGCMAPVGALGSMTNNELRLSAVVLSADGVQRLAAGEVASASEAESLGVRVADTLLQQGAAELIAASRNG
jgi:hydroxymethylbilane synthase